MTPFLPRSAVDVELEAGTKWRPPASEAAASLAGNFATQAAVALFPPALLGMAAIGIAAEQADGNPHPPYAFRELPEFFLVPATFASEAARDEFFVALARKLRASAAARRAYIDAHCRFWPCTEADAACADPVCERQRMRVDEELKASLAELPAWHARTRIVAPAAR